jgi:TRAP-type mannitol/chloroaromatic compound transport system permease small subunit
LLGVILFLIPGCLMIIATSWHFVYRAWVIGEGSPDPGGIPYRFIVKGLIPAGFGLLLLQGISMGVHSLLQILNIEKPKSAGN